MRKINGFSDFFRSFFGKKTADPQRVTYSIGGAYTIPATVQAEIAGEAMYICREFIAAAVEKCEIRTFLNGKEHFGEEYYRWNYEPNSYQTAAEFRNEFIHKLFTDTEVLIIPMGNQLIIADSFTKREYALKPMVFEEISRGDFSFERSYNTQDAIYLSLTAMGQDPEQMLRGITSTLNGTFSEAASKYAMEGGERGTFEYDNHAFGSDEEQADLQKLLDEDFRNYFRNKNAVLPIFAGTKYTPTKIDSGQKTSVVGDMKAILSQNIESCAQIYKIPAVLILGNVADTKDALDNMLTFCIDPLMKHLTERASAVLYGKNEILRGSRLTADTSAVKHFNVVDMADKMDKLIAASIMSVNEVRRRAGEPRLPFAWADEYSRTKNYETIGKE